VKKSSSRWIKTRGERFHDFYWQAGYGAFSVSESNVGTVREYIRTQQDHHRTVSFEQEYRAFLRKHGIDFDERYLWDRVTPRWGLVGREHRYPGRRDPKGSLCPGLSNVSPLG